MCLIITLFIIHNYNFNMLIIRAFILKIKRTFLLHVVEFSCLTMCLTLLTQNRSLSTADSLVQFSVIYFLRIFT